MCLLNDLIDHAMKEFIPTQRKFHSFKDEKRPLSEQLKIKRKSTLWFIWWSSVDGLSELKPSKVKALQVTISE